MWGLNRGIFNRNVAKNTRIGSDTTPIIAKITSVNNQRRS